MKNTILIGTGFVAGLLLTSLAFISIGPSKILKNKKPEYTILDVTEVPSNLSEEDKSKLLGQERSNGKIISAHSLSGFDVYEVDDRLVVVKDRYVRGVFDSKRGLYSIFPASKLALLGDGAFIIYTDKSETRDYYSLRYSQGGKIFEDYGLDGVDLIKTRFTHPEVTPKTIYTTAWGVNSYTSNAFLDDHDCVAIPFAGGVPEDHLACCQSKHTRKANLMSLVGSGKWKVITEDAVNNPAPFSYWPSFAETRENCLQHAESIIHKDWHTFEAFEPK